MAKKSNVTVHGKPMYRVRTKVGEDLNGKPVYKSFYGNGKVEAERMRDDYLSRKSSTDKTLGQLADFYTYNILINDNLAENTISLYESAYSKYFKGSSLSMLPAYNITAKDIQSFITKCNNSATFKYMRRLYKWLSQQGLCPDLMSGIVQPSKRHVKEDIEVFTEDEMSAILSTPSDLHKLYLLAFSTGLRAGELLALRHSDIKDGAVSVTRQVVQVYNIDPNGYKEYTQSITPPKSTASRRIVPIPENAFLELDVKEHCNDYLFTTKAGNLLYRGNFRRAWQRHLKKAGVPYKKFHACRATYCTSLCKNGVPLETASKLMGHSDVSITAQYYRLVSDDELTNAANLINNLFQAPSGD